MFIGQLRDALNDFKDAEQLMSDVMAKSMFLGQIQDRDYAAIGDTLMDASINFEGYMQCILDKFNMLANSKGTKDSKKANSASQDHGKNKENKKNKDKDKDKRNANSTNTNTPHKKITYEMIKATPYCVESDIWRNMTKEQQQAV